MKMILCNVGTADRVARIVAGLAGIAAGIVTESWWGAVGIVPILTATFGLCPVYRALGLSTAGRPPSEGGASS